MASAGPVPMVTEKQLVAEIKPGDVLSEKYRPKTLDEVAAHKDIISTSKCEDHGRKIS